MQLEKFLRSSGPTPTHVRPTTVGSSSSDSLTESGSGHIAPIREETTRDALPDTATAIDQDVARESLREVYYLVLLFLGEFLKNVL